MTHSSFVVTVLENPDNLYRALDMVTFGRLGRIVKKTRLLCSWKFRDFVQDTTHHEVNNPEDKNDNFVSITIDWTGWV